MSDNKSRNRQQIVEWDELLSQLHHPADRMAARSVFISSFIGALPDKVFRTAIDEVKKQLKL